MTLIADILLAGPLGYFAGKRSLAAFVAIWAVVFVVQTILVSSDGSLDALYWVFNVVFLALGIGLHAFGVWLSARRARSADESVRAAG